MWKLTLIRLLRYDLIIETIEFLIFIYYIFFSSSSLDKAEPDEDPEVTRAKYFIRDEFLVKMN